MCAFRRQIEPSTFAADRRMNRAPLNTVRVSCCRCSLLRRKELVVQNGLCVHDVSSTSLFRIQLTLVDLDPNQVSPQLVQQLRMVCMKLSVSSDNDPKDAVRVHKLDSTQTELFWPEVYGNHE